MLTHSDRLTAACLALFLFGIYLLSFSGRIYSSDGLAMFAVTESFVKRGEFSTDQLWTFFGTKSAPAPDGEVYSKYGYGTSLFAAPLYALARYVPIGGLMQTTLLAPALAVALTGALVYLAARRLNFSPGTSAITTLLFGIATPAWVYAKEFWSEPFSLVTLFATFYFLLCYRASDRRRDALLAGVALGLAVAVRTTNALLIPIFLVYGFAPTAAEWRARAFKLAVRPLFLLLLPIFLFLLSIALYNAARFGSPFTTGYRADETFSNPILLGAYGLLFSPGKGLFIYAPFLAAIPFGAWQLWRRAQRVVFLISSIFIVYLLIFSAWYYWWGGTNWAARFLVPTLPFLVLLCAPLVELIITPPAVSRLTFDVSRLTLAVSCLTFYALRFTFSLLIFISILNEIGGISITSLTYRLRLLNLSPNPDADAIFVPSFSPLIGHWQTLKPTNLDVAWLRATPVEIQIDWLVVLPTLGFVVLGAVLLARVLRGGTIARAVWIAACVGAGVLTLIAMARYADDPRTGGSEGYRALLETIRRAERAGDVVILNDDARARFWFDVNRARAKWYGLSRDPARWDAPTRALVERLTRSYSRVWFAFDDATADVPNPMREWIEENLTTGQRYDFDEGVHLILFADH